MLLADPWAWGWDALVAIGTLTLAVFTAGLAGVTLRVASKTSALAEQTKQLAVATQADVAAQFRPVVAPVKIKDETARGSTLTTWPYSWTFERTDGSRAFGLTNIGKGPALNMKVTATGSDQTVEVETTVLAADCDAVRIDVHAPIQPNTDGGYTILVEYDSVAEERYESTIVYVRRAQNVWIPRLDRVKLVSRLRYVDVEDRVDVRDSATVERKP